MSHSRELAIALAGGDNQDPGLIRLGAITAITTRNDGGSSYTVVTVDGREMRCLASFPAPTIGRVVVWLNHAGHALCLGPML